MIVIVLIFLFSNAFYYFVKSSRKIFEKQTRQRKWIQLNTVYKSYTYIIAFSEYFFTLFPN